MESGKKTVSGTGIQFMDVLDITQRPIRKSGRVNLYSISEKVHKPEPSDHQLFYGINENQSGDFYQKSPLYQM